MTEQKATTEGTVPRCRTGSRTDHQCPRPATVNPWRDGPPEICELHDRMWRLDDELNLHKTARFWLGSWEEQANEVWCPPLEEVVASARERADAEIARLEREMAAAEAEDAAD